MIWGLLRGSHREEGDSNNWIQVGLREFAPVLMLNFKGRLLDRN